jgi:hypothetical protein
MLGEGEPSFKEFLASPAMHFKVTFSEFLASPAMMRLVKSQSSLAWIVQSCSQLAIFL